jgi:hypothetical protein
MQIEMASFSCPKYDFQADCCMRLAKPCVPGQPGCVLHGKVEVLQEPVKPRRTRQAKRRPSPG